MTWQGLAAYLIQDGAVHHVPPQNADEEGAVLRAALHPDQLVPSCTQYGMSGFDKSTELQHNRAEGHLQANGDGAKRRQLSEEDMASELSLPRRNRRPHSPLLYLVHRQHC